MNKKKFLVIGIVWLWIFVFGCLGCILKKYDGGLLDADKQHMIGASYMTMNNEFYNIVSEEIIQRVEAEGDQWVLRDPALSVERQIGQINDMLSMGIDVLVLTPVDLESLTDVLKKAKEKGVYIVVVDSNVKDETLVDCTITSDNYAAGRQVGEYFAAQTKEAKVVLDAVRECEGIEIVERIECEGQQEIALPKMQELLKKGIVFDNVFCLNDLSSVGVVAALDEAGVLDRVGVYGVDASPDSKALIKEGMMKATAAQFPSKIGKTAAEQIYMLLEGKEVEAYTYIPVELVTQENVDDYGIERWQ